MMRRLAIVLLAGTALGALAANTSGVHAEDVTVNLDALGPEPAKKPAAKPAASELGVQPKPMAIGAPKPAAAPKINSKPEDAVPAAPTSSGEIDFIGRTKRAQVQPVEPAPAPKKVSAPKPAAASPVMSETVPDEEQPASKPVTPPATQPAIATPKPAPKKKETPASVVVDTGGLEGHGGAAAKPQGTPLTSIQPDGVLYVPKNVEALPQPVSVPASSAPEETESKPLTMPPALPEAPVAAPEAPPAVAPVKPTAMSLQPPSAQAVAAVASPVAAKPTASQDRASVLAGQATALEVKFEPGMEVLTPDSLAALDQIAESLKAASLRVQLAAYSGPPGNNSSDTRRLSLKRALAVRNYLDSRGVPKLTVNIAAFGGAVQGETDRVDVMVRTDQIGKLSAAQ